ncbi:MAG: 50S ribosomal protein L22 [Clostridia bacterium]|nr:50S ribosomal protein L22 [Clostridia bacterium]
MATRIRQKAEKRAAATKYPHAIAKYVRMSPSKITYILDLVRGKKAQEAVAILENMPDKGAEESLNVLKSAIANAENNMGKNAETLYVKEAYATSGPQFKRMSARAKGSGNVILKKTSHITIVLDEVVGG